MKIALDAMGGDNAPEANVLGALEAVRELGIEVVLVGDPGPINEILEKHQGRSDVSRISLIEAKEKIEMGEHPVDAVRRKKDSSLVRGVEIVRNGTVPGLVTAGNTGAAMAASLLMLGRIRGIDRPAIATPMPTLKGVSVLLDAGANVDCRPKHLYQFARMGVLYAERVLKIERARVGLLNIGEEEGKGNEVSIAAHALLKNSDLNFVGNIEGKDIIDGAADVVVCDGFVGNVVLKFAEGLGTGLFSIIKREAGADLRSRLGGLLLKPAFGRVKRLMDYSEYGGAPLLGLRGTVIIGHGRSTPKAIKNALRVAAEAAREGLVESIGRQVSGDEGARQEERQEQ